MLKLLGRSKICISDQLDKGECYIPGCDKEKVVTIIYPVTNFDGIRFLTNRKDLTLQVPDGHVVLSKADVLLMGASVGSVFSVDLNKHIWTAVDTIYVYELETIKGND